MKSGNLNFLEPSGPLQACNGTALSLPFTVVIFPFKVWLRLGAKIFRARRSADKWTSNPPRRVRMDTRTQRLVPLFPAQTVALPQKGSSAHITDYLTAKRTAAVAMLLLSCHALPGNYKRFKFNRHQHGCQLSGHGGRN